jgi:hypothetical protein
VGTGCKSRVVVGVFSRREVLRVEGKEEECEAGCGVGFLLCKRGKPMDYSGQAYKGARGMPRHGQAMKGVVSCEKHRGAARRR